MTRRRSRVPGPVRPDRRRSTPIRSMLAMIVVAGLVVACGAGPEETPADGSPTASSVPTATSGAASPTPASGPTDPAASAAPTEAPVETDEPAETDEAPASDEPSPADPDAGASSPCAGSDENRAFFASVAAAVDWPVYCPVLGDGWFVDAGQYRLAGGGRMEISYRGPSGARIALREGSYCDGDCSPGGTDLGEAAFGGMSGVIRDVGDGSYAVLVDPGASPSWELVASGSSEEGVRTIAADLALVDD